MNPCWLHRLTGGKIQRYFIYDPIIIYKKCTFSLGNVPENRHVSFWIHSMMNTLFPVWPEGFSYFPEFISSAEEQQLLEIIAGIALHPMVFQGYTANRKVASFGFDYSFTSRKLSEGIPIPGEFEFLLSKVAMQPGIQPVSFKELLVTEYLPGNGSSTGIGMRRHSA